MTTRQMRIDPEGVSRLVDGIRGWTEDDNRQFDKLAGVRRSSKRVSKGTLILDAPELTPNARTAAAVATALFPRRDP